MSSLQTALQIIRDNSSNTTEQGNAFERLVKVFLENDPTQKQQYGKVWHYKDWAKKHPDYPSTDTGIDLIAELRDEEGFCAVQCKFHQSGSSITKASTDSFLAAATSYDFTRLVLIDTTNQPIGERAAKTLTNLGEKFTRLSLDELDKSPIDWTTYIQDKKVRLSSKKKLRDDQIEVIKRVKEGLAKNDRGKMIMACGTGKTFTSLRIAEELAGAGKMVLYMVPSLPLMSQAIREWKNDAAKDITAFSVCSDTKVGRRKSQDDKIEVNLNDLALPATTNARKLSKQIAKTDKSKMTVVFSTYHSIDVLSQSQKKHDLEAFDLIICDEAHRTTGATFEGEDESNFVKIHDDKHVKGKKRLYMTATPRIYGDAAKRKADEGDVALASMDDKKMFGENLVSRSFNWAVQNDLLTDYKVVVLTMDEKVVSDRVQKAFTEGSILKLDDATKMVGCYKALAKIGITDLFENESRDKKPMKRALAFCQNIAVSKLFSKAFSDVVEEYTANEEVSDEYKTDLKVELSHVDGTFNAQERNEELGWLRDDANKNVCRVLSNAKCLSEGVDVPALDAVMFLHPRKSQIDVVQAVGRVMRKSEGKKLGYVILPIAVAPGVSPEKALNDNERYRVVWQILNALRAHDERLNGTINQIRLGEDVSDRIDIVDITAVVEDVRKKPETQGKKEKGKVNLGEGVANDEEKPPEVAEQEQLAFHTDLSQAIKAKIVDKCGTRDYWETWASDIAEIAKKHIIRINSIVLGEDKTARKAFEGFLAEIRDDLNPSITENDAIEMLAQHIITRPVFDTLFQGNQFTSENAVSKAMEKVLSRIYKQNIEAESKSLEKFYASVKQRATGIKTSTGRQTLILDLYDKFFRNAFPKMTEKLGIVYTPVEVVDFIIHSVEDVMKDEFDSSLGNSDVDILDPFSGTGTFISRLLQSGILSEEQIKRKFTTEIHANEMVLLAYYIACINIEAVYSDLVKEDKYQPFDGMVLTDTFQLYEQERDMIADLLPDNSERRTRQKEREITVVIGNPPYSAGQSSANDNAANLKYPNLDERIRTSYAEASSATNRNSLYDSYIRAFRWATDRIGDEGVVGFVTNAGWIDGNAADGFRKCLGEEFNKIYVFHLRGNARTQGELRRKEKDNVFGGGSRAPVAITILVRNKKSKEKGKIYFHEMGDYLDRKQKLAIIQDFKSIKSIQEENKFEVIEPDEDNDWVNQKNKSFNKHLPLGDKSKQEKKTIFETYSNGLKTNCDAWLYNSSKSQLQETIRKLVDTYNEEMKKYQKSDKNTPVENFVDKDPKKISWHSSLFPKAAKGVKATFEHKNFVDSLYRPFHKQVVYYDKHFVQRLALMPSIFKSEVTKNLVIGVTGVGANQFSCLITDRVPDLSFLASGQCFPLHLINKEEDADLITPTTSNASGMRDAINPEVLKGIRKSLGQEKITNEMLFQYIYAVLHSQDYRDKYANNLSKELPRIPIVKTSQKFFDFVEAGKELIRLHVDYEKVEEYPVKIKQGDFRLATIKDPKSFFYVKQMKFPNKKDKSTVFYNDNITIQNIPPEAYEYVINQKSALEWVMERQCVKVDKDSGIKNDANDYANETMNNPAYPLKLFQRVITVSLETMKIVKSLPDPDLD